MNSGLASPPSTAAKPRPARAALWPAAAATAPLFRLQIARPRRGESLVDEERFLKTTCSLRLRDYAPSGQQAAQEPHPASRASSMRPLGAIAAWRLTAWWVRIVITSRRMAP